MRTQIRDFRYETLDNVYKSPILTVIMTSTAVHRQKYTQTTKWRTSEL